MSLIFSNLVVQNLSGYKIIAMHNLMKKKKKILENSKQYAGNQVNGKRKFSIWSIIYVVILYHLYFFSYSILILEQSIKSHIFFTFSSSFLLESIKNKYLYFFHSSFKYCFLPILYNEIDNANLEYKVQSYLI